VRTIVIGLILLLVLIAGSTAQTTSRPLDGKALYRKHKCPICHGPSGNKAIRDGYPLLAGQNKTYLVEQTIDIRDGVRDNGQTKLMRPLILRLTRPEIEKIADYLSRQ
jgi:cytochrome c